MKKSKKAPWCPLIGPGPYNEVIERARLLWGRPGMGYSPKTIKKAKQIYDRWDEFQSDPLNLDRVQAYADLAVNSQTAHREEYLTDITLLFYGLEASIQEVFSIMAIYEAQVSKAPAWPLELLTIAKEYSPDALLGKDRRVQVKNWGLRRWIDSNSDSEKAEWLKMGNEYRKKHPNKKLHSSRWVAKNICVILNLPEKSFQTVYKYLLKNNV